MSWFHTPEIQLFESYLSNTYFFSSPDDDFLEAGMLNWGVSLVLNIH